MLWLPFCTHGHHLTHAPFGFRPVTVYSYGSREHTKLNNICFPEDESSSLLTFQSK